MLGIISIDTLLVFRASVSSNNEYKRMGTYEFVSRLTYLMINNERPGFEQTPRAARTATRPRAEEAEESALPVHLRHNARSYGKKNEQPDFDLAMCKGDAASAYKQRCYVCARDKTAFPYGVKTSFYCGHEYCGRAVPLCRDGTGVHSRRCFEVHISECTQRSISLGTALSSSSGPGGKARRYFVTAPVIVNIIKAQGRWHYLNTGTRLTVYYSYQALLIVSSQTRNFPGCAN
jgi:hypothetical protein